MVTVAKTEQYYEKYKAINVTFSREVIQVTGLLTKQVYLKCGGDFWPCVVVSSSFQGAKIVASSKSKLIEKLHSVNNLGSLRLAFKEPDSTSPLTFFINIKATSGNPYGATNEMLVLTLQYTQRPPDDFIDIIGRVLDANISFSKRKEERISLSKEAMRKLQILAGESAVFIGGVPRRCILRDVSFSGAKFIMVGVAKFLLNKEASLRIDFQDPRESFLIQGTFVRTEMIEGRTDLIAVGMKFNEELIPMGYKMRINDYLSSKPIERVAPAPAAAPAAKPAAPAAPEEKTDAK